MSVDPGVNLLDTTRSDAAAAEPRKRIKAKDYERELARLQEELVRLQRWIRHKGLKVVVIFEGRDAAGKGGVIKRISERLNPRVVRVVALGTPSDREKTQWWFQRYVEELPAAGEMVLFDRSWYNRGLVEPVMGFCTEDEYREFLRSCPEFERMLVRSGIILIKYWFSVSDAEQERRFQNRINDPKRRWKLSQMDLEGRARWGGVLQGQGHAVRPHRHQAGALVRRQRRLQEGGPAELHLTPAVDDPLRGRAVGGGGVARAPGADRLRAPRPCRTRPSCPRSTERLRARQRPDEFVEGVVGDGDHLLVGAVLDGMAGEHRGGVEAERLGLRAGRGGEVLRQPRRRPVCRAAPDR